jgi:hypothetical protein
MSLFGGNSGGNQASSYGMLINALNTQAAYDNLNKWHDVARGDLTAHNYWQPGYDAAYGSNGQGGSLAMLQNSLGLNGQTGRDAAMQAFQGYNPGYQAALDAGVQARDRSAASRGMLGSGNQAMALQKYGQDLQNQNYGDWQSKIGGLTQLGSQAAAGMTGQQNNLANLDMGLGNSLSGLYQNMGGQASKMAYDGSMADSAANAQGQKNLFSAITGGLNLGANLFGML